MALFQGLANMAISALRGGNKTNSSSSTKTTTTSTSSTASTNTRPTPGRGNYGSNSTTTNKTSSSSSTNRSDSAGAQALTQQITSNSSTKNTTTNSSKTGNSKIDSFVSAVKENVSNSSTTPKTTVTEAMRDNSNKSEKQSSATTSKKTQNQTSSSVISTIIEDKPARTVTEAMRENVPKVDYSAPKQSDYTPVKSTATQKSTDKPIYDVPIIGDAILTAESIIWNPDGSLNKDGGLFYSHPGTLTQAEKYDIYDGSGTERMTAGANTIVNLVGAAVLPGAGGAVMKGGQIGLRELGKAAGAAATKEAAERGLKGSALIGLNRFGNFATKPLLETNSALVRAATTPATIPLNTASGVVLADAGKDVVEKTQQHGLGIGALTAAGYGLSFGVGGVTAHQAQKIVNKIDDTVRTKGLIEIRQEPGLDTESVIYRPAFTSEGLPLGKGQTLETVEQSFRENRLIPMPYESTFRGEGDNTLNELYHTVSAKLPGKDDSIQVYHATPYDIQGDMIVKGSKSEFDGLYGSPRPLSYFSKVEQWSNPHFSLMPFVAQYKPAVSPSFVHISMPKDTQFTKNPTKTDKPQLHAPLIKEEYEAILPPGTQLKGMETRYAINVNGRKLPVREKEFDGFVPPQRKTTKKRSSDNSYEYHRKEKDSSMAYAVAFHSEPYSRGRKDSGYEESILTKDNGILPFDTSEEDGGNYREAFTNGLLGGSLVLDSGGGDYSASNPLKNGSIPSPKKKGGFLASSIGEEYGVKTSSIYRLEDEDDKDADKRKKQYRRLKTDTFFVSRGISDAFDMVGSSLLPKVKKKNVRAKVASEFYEFGDKNTYKMTVHNSKYKSFPLPELKSKKPRKTTHKRRSKK